MHDGFNGMMGMPYGYMGVGMLLAVLVLLAIGFAIGYAVGRSR